MNVPVSRCVTCTTPTMAACVPLNTGRTEYWFDFIFVCYAKINELGFIETPYRKVKDAVVDMSPAGIQYFTAEEEEDLVVAQGNAMLNDDGTFVRSRIKSRFGVDFRLLRPMKHN